VRASKEQLEELKRELERLRDRLHDLSVREQEMGRRLDPIEKRADALRADRVSIAIRDSYVRLTNAGTFMTKVHLDMNVPPTVFQTPGEEQEQHAAVTKEAAPTQEEVSEEALEERDKAALREELQ
jgi:chromosome segregation ATPase